MPSKVPRCLGSWVAALGAACQTQTLTDRSQSNAVPATQPESSAVSPLAPDPLSDRQNPSELDSPEARRLRLRLVASIAANNDVHDKMVLQALRDVPRHLFTNEVPLDLAYADHPLPIGYGQTISQPTIVAIMTEALELTGHERVLEIGTGSGYQAAILSLLAREVFSIELIAELGQKARLSLARFGYRNIELRIGNGYEGWHEKAPFDRILLTAAPSEVPGALLDQLADHGILVAPVGREHGDQTLYRYRKHAGSVEKEDLGGVRFVPMVTSRDSR
jgi:protein-L-isoaspartate(D-aspartate) O-methyltransferase